MNSEKLFLKKKKCTNINQKLFYYSKNFLSFSKDEKTAKSPIFFNNNNNQNNTVTVLFIIEKCKNEKYFISNIDIKSLSNYKNEEEVLILPLTCFEVVDIGKNENYGNVTYRKIYLRYLDKYLDQITKKIEKLNSNPDKKRNKPIFH